MRLGRSFPLLLLLLTACPGDDEPVADPTGDSATEGTTTESSSDTSTSTEGEPFVPSEGCECIRDEEPADTNSGPKAPLCSDSPCPNVAGGCGASVCQSEEEFELVDPAALECALVALRDRTPGLLTWSFIEGDGIYSEDGYILVKDDGTAIRRQWDREDLNFTVSDAALGPLPPAEAFDACLAEPDDLTRFDCLRARLDRTGVCDEGWKCWECF